MIKHEKACVKLLGANDIKACPTADTKLNLLKALFLMTYHRMWIIFLNTLG